MLPLLRARTTISSAAPIRVARQRRVIDLFCSRPELAHLQANRPRERQRAHRGGGGGGDGRAEQGHAGEGHVGHARGGRMSSRGCFEIYLFLCAFWPSR